MVDGFTNGSDRDIAGNSIGKPPACTTPRLTSSARSRRCVWQKLMSLQVLMMPITGLPAKSVSSKPPWRNRARWPKARRSLTPSQRWLRSSSGRLGLFIRTGACSPLIDRQIGCADHLFPFGGFIRDKLPELGGRSRNRCAAELLEFGQDRRILQRQVGLFVEDIDDFLWRSLRHSEAKEGARFEARHSLGNRRHVRQLFRTLRGCYRQRAQLAGLDVIDR